MRPIFRLARILLPILLVVVLAGLVYFFVVRARPGEAYGAAVALCPGPDLYGYTCEGAEGYAYIDATQDTALYVDDGLVTLELPFPFTFYGTVYTEVQASVNGNLQFDTANPLFRHSCLAEGPAAEMGDMIAPYWTDLDLRAAGFLETETAGLAPQRVFVIEWDAIPVFGGDLEDTVTFAVQLFEGSNDIVFLYEDTTTLTGSNGSNALVGLQSAAQGVALQFSCNQPVVGNASGLRFPHPVAPNRELGMATGGQSNGGAGEIALRPLAGVPAKEPVATLLESLNREGSAVLEALRGRWVNQRPPRAFTWHWLDLTGDGHDELLALWQGRPSRAELTEVAVLGTASGDALQLLFHEQLSTRQEPSGPLSVHELLDLTGDGHVDALLYDQHRGRLYVIAAPDNEAGVTLFHVPEQCQGSLIVRETGSDLPAEIIRDGCDTPGRIHVRWDGDAFSIGQE